RETLLGLVQDAHFFIESDSPGALEALGLGYEALAAINPALVYVSITPFGQDGPKAGYAATDLIVEAAGGNLVLQGDADRPPVRVSVPQAYCHAGAEAAGAALVAHHERQRSGRGQHVDVSAQQAVNQATFSSSLAVPLGDERETMRFSGGTKTGPLIVKGVWPTKDGYVAIAFWFGSALGVFAQRFMQYVYEEGFCDEATRDKDWLSYAQLLLSGQEPIEEYERIKEVIEAFTKTKTKAELLAVALQRGLLIAPFTTIHEVVTSEQLAARQYWPELHHQELGRDLRHPGPFVKLSETPITYRRRPPTVGEHNAEVLGERADGQASTGPPDHKGEQRANALPLADVKVLDLMWAMAGPATTRVLADYGATVVRVESTKRIDTVRTMGVLHNGEAGAENAGLFLNLNAGKRGLTFDLAKEEGRAVILDLVRWADVVTESFSPKAMRNWGLDYESIKQVKPEMIMVNSCLMGQSGPLSMYAGFGNLASAISGFSNLAGWPDRPPAGPFLAYTDTVAPRFTVAAILAALDHRRRTGQGQYLDQSQAEAALHFLGPALLDYTVNGRVQERIGNRDPYMAPHGVYPAAGDDRWVAIAVADDAQWQALCEVIGRPELATDERFATLEARLANQDELDDIVSEWSRQREMSEAESALQARAVPAHAVQNSKELYADPQLH
ncbi:MAG: CoA transferase, partial [Chloroflexi bacterium]|nr:CoA transferase [Chloroflexota bacterium]